MAQEAPPEVGTVLDGYRFKGGDPKQESSWEQVEPIAAPEYGPGAQRLPNGAVVRYGPRGGMDTIVSATQAASGNGGGAQSSPLVGADARARFMINLGPLEAAQRTMEQMDQAGYTLDQDWGAAALESIPWDGGFVARRAGGEDYNAYVQAAKTFEAAIMPIMSGAAVTPSEAQRLIRAAIPQPGDSPEVLAQKSEQRRMMINAVAEGVGKPAPFGADMPQMAEEAASAGLSGGGIGGAAAGLAPGSYEPTDQLRALDADSNGQVSVEELEAAGMRFENGQWVLGGPSDGGAPPASRSAPSEPSPEAVEGARGRLGMLLGGQSAFMRGAIEQAPFFKEAAAGVGALVTGESYGDIRRGQDALVSYDRENNREQRNLGGVAGFSAGVVSPGALAAGRWVAQAPKLGYAMTRGAAVGAGSGAVFGAANTEGGLAERGQGAVQGAMVGGVTGGALPPVARLTGAMTEGLTRPVRQAVGDGIARMTGRPMSGEDRAVRSLLRGSNPDQMAERLAEGRRYGADLTLADVGGSNAQSRVRVAATRQTRGREVAQDFSASRRSEVQDFTAGLGQRVSPMSASPQQLDTALEQYQRQASAPAFAAARASPSVQIEPDVAAALYAGEGRTEMARAARLYRSSPDPDEQALADELEQLSTRALQPGEPLEISVGAADLAARYLQQAGGMDMNAKRILGSLGTALRDSARSQSAPYDQALTDYASRARLGGAVETGERFLGRGYTGDFVEAAGGMDDAQRGIARASARAGIERASETAGSAPGVLDKLATGRGQQQRSVALLGPEGAADLQQGARVGRRMVDAGNNVNPRAGSNTYLNAQDENAQAVGGIVGNLASGRPMQALGGVVDLIRSAGMSDDQAEAIVRLATDPARAEQALQILRTRFPEQEARKIMSQLTPVIAAQAGASSAPQPQVRMVGPRP